MVRDSSIGVSGVVAYLYFFFHAGHWACSILIGHLAFDLRELDAYANDWHGMSSLRNTWV
jgi:hypothetical protein